jgi:hypothetical protein
MTKLSAFVSVVFTLPVHVLGFGATAATVGVAGRVAGAAGPRDNAWCCQPRSALRAPSRRQRRGAARSIADCSRGGAPRAGDAPTTRYCEWQGASEAQITLHDRKARELASYKLGRTTKNDADGYHRVACPAVAGKIRCPLRPESLSVGHSHPEVTKAPADSPCCCVQKTITVPPEVNAKTAQRHDYPSPERANATLKDPSSTDITRGSIRLMGQSAITIVVACAVVVRNIRIVAAFEAREAENASCVGSRRAPERNDEGPSRTWRPSREAIARLKLQADNPFRRAPFGDNGPGT